MSSQTVLKKQERLVSINSSDRIYGSSSDFKVLLTDSIISLRRFRLLSACVPYSFYDIGNASFFIFEEQAGGGQVLIQFPPGNYTPATLATELTMAMTSSSPNGYTYSVVFDTSTLKYDISVLVGGGNFRILWTTMYNYPSAHGIYGKNNVPYQLGFANLTPDSIPDPDSLYNTFFLSTGAGAISYRNYLWITVGPVFPNRILNTSNASISYTMPVSGNFGDKLYFNINSDYDQDLNYAAMGSTAITEFQVTIKDEDNTIVDLNGVDCAFTFAYEVYDP